MSNQLILIDCIGEINMFKSENNPKIALLNYFNAQYELLITNKTNRNVFYCKFSTNEAFSTGNMIGDSLNEQEITRTKLKILTWKTIYLPFDITELVLSRKKVWVAGHNFLVDIKYHIQKAVSLIENKRSEEEKTSKCDLNYDHLMNVDPQEFFLQDFNFVTEVSSIEKLKFPEKSFCIASNLCENKILTCTANYKTESWQIGFIGICSNSLETKYAHLLNIPLTYVKKGQYIKSISDDIQQRKPVITFMHRKGLNQQASNLTKHNVLQKLFSDAPASSNSLCMIGHPEGNILYCFCSWSDESENLKVISQTEEVCHIKQQVIGIHFTELKGVEGYAFILIIGSLGKLVLISTEKIQSSSKISQTTNTTIYISALNLPTQIHNHLVYQNCIFYVSNSGDLWLSRIFSAAEKNPLQKIQLLPSLLIHRVADIAMLNSTKGLFLVTTISGILNVYQYSENAENQKNTPSLPFLMNKIMHQSRVLKSLAEVYLQEHKIFTALSVFSSLKYASKGFEKFSTSWSVSENSESNQNFIVSIQLNCAEKLNSEFWFVTASLYSHFQQKSALISKTIPYHPDINLDIEIQESLLSQHQLSPFPVYIEVGLLLGLPEKLKKMPPFQLLEKELPLYLRVETIVLNETYFIKHKVSNSQIQSSARFRNSKIITSKIHEMSSSRPLYNLLPIRQKFLCGVPRSFAFCLLTSTAKQMVNIDYTGSLLASQIFDLILERSHLKCRLEDNRLVIKNQQISIMVHGDENKVCITVNADSFPLLAGVRMAVTELLLNKQRNLQLDLDLQCVTIPAAMNKKCEEISKYLLKLLSNDCKMSEFLENLVSVYNTLRTTVSNILPFS